MGEADRDVGPERADAREVGMGTQEGSSGRVAVVIIDDNADHAELLAGLLRGSEREEWPEGLEVHVFADPADALANLPLGEPVVLCDHCLRGSYGLDWMADFARAGCGPVILLTSSGSEDIAARAFRQRIADYLVKGEVFEQPTLLTRSMREALRRHRLERRNQELARELRSLNAELVRKNARLAELTTTAHRFVDDVAHEFRTPLAVIREFTSIIADRIGGEVTSKQAEYLRHIDEASRDLSVLVDDFLDTSRLRARTLRVDRRGHRVEELLSAVRAPLMLRASAKGIVLSERIPEDLPEFFADLGMLKRILMNLGVNAVKFSPPGTEVTITGTVTEAGEVELAVGDRGCGMTPEDLETIFQRFSQAGEAKKAGLKGFGLGLSIANELAKLNLGRLSARSEPGQGSVFSFTLPRNDRGMILDRYFDEVCAESEARAVTLLRGVVTDGSLTGEDARVACVSVCRPMDLVLAGEDGRSVSVVGLTGDAPGFVGRLTRGVAEVLGGRATVLFTPVGSWPADLARSMVPDTMSEEAAHAS